jgi:hypothetical protein
MSSALPITAISPVGAVLPPGLNLSLIVPTTGDSGVAPPALNFDFAVLLPSDPGALPSAVEAVADEDQGTAATDQAWALLLVPELAIMPAPVAGDAAAQEVVPWPPAPAVDPASRSRVRAGADAETAPVVRPQRRQTTLPYSSKQLSMNAFAVDASLMTPVSAEPVQPGAVLPDAAPDGALARALPVPQIRLPAPVAVAEPPVLAASQPAGSDGQSVSEPTDNVVRPVPDRVRPLPAGDRLVPDPVRVRPAASAAILPPEIDQPRARMRAPAEPLLLPENTAALQALPAAPPLPPAPGAAITAAPPAPTAEPNANPAVNASAEPAIAIASDRLGAVSVRLNGGAQDLQVSVQVQPAAAALIGAEGGRLQQDLAAAGVALSGLSVNGQRADLSGGGSRRGARPPRPVVDPIAGPARLNRPPARSIDRFA